MSKIRQRSKNLMYSGLAGAAIMGIVFASYVIYDTKENNEQKMNLRLEYEQQIKVMKDEQAKQAQSMINGYASSHDIAPGQMIKEKDLVAVKIPMTVSPANLIGKGKDIVGSTSKIELRQGTVLTQSMFFEGEAMSSDLRNKEVNAINLPTNLQKEDVIDVRIQFPTGQDYIVLSKKKIDNLLSPTMWITLNEMEILTFSSAMVDAFLHKASLYALTYVEPQMQSEAIPTYPVNREVQKLIASDPNIVNKAERYLSESIRKSLETDLERLTTVSGMGSSDTTRSLSYSSAEPQTILEMNDNGTSDDSDSKNDILTQNIEYHATFSDVQDNASP